MSLRVAFVMSGVGVVQRGAEAFLIDLARALNKDYAVESTFFCRGSPSVPHHRVFAIPRDHRLVNRLYRLSRVGRKALDTVFIDPLSLEWYSCSVAALPGLWRHPYDLVVMEGGLVGLWVCRLLRRVRGTPFIDIAHCNSAKWEGAFARQKPDRVVALTQWTARMIRDRAPDAKITVIPGGIDLGCFTPHVKPVAIDLPRPIFLTAGEVEREKRMHEAVYALARLGKGSLVVLGDGRDAAALDGLAVKELGPERYRRTRVPRSEMPAWLRTADCFTLPSQSESFGLVYLEALACGRPCVAPDDGVRREVIANAGLYYELGDVEGYARALEDAVSRTWGDGPRQQAERFNIADTVAAYHRLFQELTG